MSYILDALRKADAQRERSRLPGLQAQPHAAGHESAGAVVPPAMLATVAVALGLGFAAVAAWQLTRDDAAPAMEVAVAPQAAAAAAVPVEAPPVPAAQILPPAPPPLPAPVPSPKPLMAKAAPTVPAAPASAVPASSPQVAAAPAQAAQKPMNAAVDAVSFTVPAGAPKLAVSGGVWSQDPVQRMLIVNGQVFNEGSELAPGVRLQEIRQHGAVLDFRGQRYAVPY